LAFIGDDIGSLIEEDNVLMRYVGMHRHFIARQVVIDEKAAPFVDNKFFHERGVVVRRLELP
jgi:hypothetical protein